MMTFVGYNYKRGRKEKRGDYRNTKLYGMVFPFRRRVVCKDQFINEIGLNNPSIRMAAISAIDADYGIKIEMKGSDEEIEVKEEKEVDEE